MYNLVPNQTSVTLESRADNPTNNNTVKPPTHSDNLVQGFFMNPSNDSAKNNDAEINFQNMEDKKFNSQKGVNEEEKSNYTLKTGPTSTHNQSPSNKPESPLSPDQEGNNFSKYILEKIPDLKVPEENFAQQGTVKKQSRNNKSEKQAMKKGVNITENKVN